jgi:hypothetical protein
MADRIEAVSVNHNTSPYMELMLRSLFARHAPGLDLRLTVFDNASDDDGGGLRAYAARRGVPIVPSGFTTQSRNNSHGEILRRFVLDRPDCTHYLFLDADVCFVQDDTLPTMLRELAAAGDAFGIGPRLSWDGLAELPAAVSRDNPDIYAARLHPCCALVKNTDLFRRVVGEIGLSCVRYLWAERDQYLDTFKLMTRVMATHGLRHRLSSAMVIHFFCVSYDQDPAPARARAERRDALLASLRSAEAG